MNLFDDSKVRFYSKSTEELTSDDWERCSELYSNHYGVYGDGAPEERKGGRVRMSPSFYRRNFIVPGYRVVIAELDGVFIGQAFYLRDSVDGDRFTWVLQLVVHGDYRKKGIGSKLLHSIWGFSNDAAWGLATANPFTVKTLEKTTLRHVNPKEIRRHESLVREICFRIPYILNLEITDTSSVADTKFFVDAAGLDEDALLSKFGDSWVLGSLPSGHEWVAFTFRDQSFDDDFSDELGSLMSFSEERLKDAYSRMDMDRHPWSKHAAEEISVIDGLVGGFAGKSVLDAGCGHGRHSLALSQMFPDVAVTAVDFSDSNITAARKLAGVDSKVKFEVADLRDYHCAEMYDVVLCLYDVVGSFPDDSDNAAILRSLETSCRSGGYLALSVMNLELTVSKAEPDKIGDIGSHPEMIFDLSPSDIMHRSGDVFDPHYYAVDPDTGIVYRKEQFAEDSALPAEYVIRDRRFTRADIESMVCGFGFDIIESRYVRAGRWDKPLGHIDDGAKEILVIARKR